MVVVGAAMAIEERIKMSLLYSASVAIIIIMALAISSQFMGIQEGEPFDIIVSVLLNTAVILFIFFLCILASVALGFSFLFFRLDYMQARLLEKLQEIGRVTGSASTEVSPAEDPNLQLVIDFVHSNPDVEAPVLIRQLEHAGFRPETIRHGVIKALPTNDAPAKPDA